MELAALGMRVPCRVELYKEGLPSPRGRRVSRSKFIPNDARFCRDYPDLSAVLDAFGQQVVIRSLRAILALDTRCEVH